VVYVGRLDDVASVQGIVEDVDLLLERRLPIGMDSFSIVRPTVTNRSSSFLLEHLVV
jgi:hypothetical protein